MDQTHDYIERLKKFADNFDGNFKYQNQPTSTMKRFGWSKVEIKISQPDQPIYYSAYGGVNSSDVYSGFYAETKLSPGITCKISRKDPLDKFLRIFGTKIVKTNQPGFDKMFTVKTNNETIVRQLTGKKSIMKFFELHLVPPLQLEIIDNEKGYIKDLDKKTNLIALKSNRWMVDHKQLSNLLDGFKLIINEIG